MHNMGIVITDQETVHRGDIDDTFMSLLDSWLDEPPVHSLDARELWKLWASGDGDSDRAWDLCASLGINITVTQDQH